MKRKIIVLGSGFVGSSTAALLLNSDKNITHLGILDINQDKAQCLVYELQTMAHALNIKAEIFVASPNDYADCDFLFTTAGVPQKESAKSSDRNSAISTQMKIYKGICNDLILHKFDGFIINLANPCDFMSYYMHKVTNLPANKIIGSGTALDSSRGHIILAQMLNDILGTANYTLNNVTCNFILEHGGLGFVDTNSSNVDGMALYDFLIQELVLESKVQAFIEVLETRIKTLGWSIVANLGATSHGVGAFATKIYLAIVNDTNEEIYTSCILPEQEIALSLNTVVNAKGISKINKIELNDFDKPRYQQSLNQILALYKENF